MEERKYFGCRLVQRVALETVPFFVFYARAKDIIQWTGIRRVQDFEDGTQRVLRPTRKRAITRFLKADSINTIPSSVLLAFEPDVATFEPLPNEISTYMPEIDFLNKCNGQIEWGVLQFSFESDLPDHLKPALIVDGQHRLYGISALEDENLPLLVVSLLNAPLQEQAFQFVVINNKAVRVPIDNVRAIIAHLDEEALQNRLLKAGVSYGNKSPLLKDINDLPSSPFQNLLIWPYNKSGLQLVPLTAVEQSLRYLQSLFPPLDEDEDSSLEIFCAIWRAIKSNYPDLWGKEESKFMKKVNINAVNEFVADRLKFAWEMSLADIFDSATVEKQVSSIVQLLPQEFWQVDWSVKIQDNSNVRNLIKSDLATLANNSRLRRPWREDLKLPMETSSEESD